MQSWAQLQRELLPRGYKAAAFVSFTCREHGRFRAGVARLHTRIPCPRCGLACKINFLAAGLTRRPLPVVEQQSAEMRAPSGVHELKHISRVSRKAFERKPAKLTLSRFERQVRKLHLADDQASQLRSEALRRWAQENRFTTYVPEFLLLQWSLPVFERDAFTFSRG